jgi:hypothetical protein
MQILFAISVLSFIGIVLAALAFARHIKAGQLRNRTDSLSIVPARPDFKHHLLHAPVSNASVDFTPRIKSAPNRTAFIPEITPVLRSRGVELRQSAKDITAKKQWSMPPQSARPQRRTLLSRTLHPEPTQSLPILALRRPPLPARHDTMERLDPTYFNKDLGDLTDPYQSSPVRVNERRPSSSRKF